MRSPCLHTCPACAPRMGDAENTRLAGPEGSAMALNCYDRPAMGTIPNLLVLIVGFNLEAQLATIDFEQLGPYRHLLALRRGTEVLDVDLKADGGVPVGQMGLHRLDARALHQADHGWGGQHSFAPHVLDDQLLVNRYDELGFESWHQAIRWHACSPVLRMLRWLAASARLGVSRRRWLWPCPWCNGHAARPVAPPWPRCRQPCRCGPSVPRPRVWSASASGRHHRPRTPSQGVWSRCSRDRWY